MSTIESCASRYELGPGKLIWARKPGWKEWAWQPTTTTTYFTEDEIKHKTQFFGRFEKLIGGQLWEIWIPLGYLTEVH